MKLFIVIVASATAGLMAQKLEKAIRVETAKDHLTVIEFSDAVTTVAVGNRGAFTVERRENKVFVTPTDDGVRTNLLIWTSGGRYVYELVPAKDIDQMQFAIDEVAAPLATLAPPPSEDLPEKTTLLPEEMLTQARPILIAGERDTNGRVEVTVRDLYQKENRLYMRYALFNHGGAGYQPSRPAAWRLEGATAHQSLLPLADRQLGEKLARTVKAANESAVEIVDAGQVETVAAGGRGLGWLVVEGWEPSSEGGGVLRIQFAADAKGAVEAILVLPEVARVRPAVE